MNVHLTPELDQIVYNKVKTGRYNSASEVVREALRLMEERDQMKMLRKNEIQKKIADGLELLRLGKDIDGDIAFDQIEAELDALDEQSK